MPTGQAIHGLTYEPSITAMLDTWHGPPVPVDVSLVRGEDLRIGGDSILEVLHVPGHAPGHLMLWDAAHRVALIADALNGATQIDRHGTWTAPPPYTDRDGYLMAIQTVQALDPAVLLAGHYPVMRGPDIGAFVDASRDFVHRVDRVLERLLADGEPLTLATAIERANPLLGPFGFPLDLSFALAAQLEWLERSGRVLRLHREGVVAWQAL